ncbi:protocadherin gamma-A12-like protein [Labeo rohita]|uniref:Protocadherin gamma-A12-like protein n=1 Tax=Labeo rohita TaxID=84645 RepID=A0A498LV96_LABRO|nr:protocadherin gamma-A12-like protein [Labeo rohita]
MRKKGCLSTWPLCILPFFVHFLCGAYGQVRYSVPEEMAPGSFVGDIVKDLGLELKRLTTGKARIFTAGGREYVALDREKGHIIIKERIDRELLCAGAVSACSLSFEVILENPIELYRITIEILDVNDNSPAFPRGEITLEINVGGTGTLQHVYNYEVCGTTDSRKSDLKFLRPSSQSVLNFDLSGTRTVPKQNRNTEEPDVSAELRKMRFVCESDMKEI